MQLDTRNHPQRNMVLEAEESVRSGSSAQVVAHVTLFGYIAVDIGGRTLGPKDLGGRKSKQLLEILALARGAPVVKERVIDLIWGEQLPRQPAAALDHNVSLLRSALAVADQPSLVRTGCGGYLLDPDRVEIDLDVFDQRLEAAGRLEPPAALDVLERALSLADGDLLEDEPYSDWLRATRDEYRERVQRVLLDAARLALLTDQPDRALTLGRRAIAHAPIASEEAYHLTASALQSLGRRTEGLNLLREAEEAIRRDFGIPLAPEMEALRASFQGTEPVPSVSIGLGFHIADAPPEVPFIGREEELDRIRRAGEGLVEGEPMLALVEGTRGIGKTRFLEQCRLMGLPVLSVPLACSPLELQIPRLAASRLCQVVGEMTGEACCTPGCTATGDEVTSELFQRLVDGASRLSPLLVLVDDIHWADPVSVRIFEALALPGIGVRMGFVATRAPGLTPADHAVRTLRPTLRIELQPLGPMDLDRLGLPDGLRQTGGHPAEISAYFEAASDSGMISERGVGRILAICDEAGPLTRQMLTTAAALDQPFGLDELAYLLGLARSTAAGAIDRALAYRLIRDVGGRFEFTAELTRLVLLATIPAHRSSAIRTLAARTLARAEEA